MSTCEKLYRGYGTGCLPLERKLEQTVVLINKADVSEYVLETSSVSPGGVYTCAYGIRFKLNAGKKGFLVEGPANGEAIAPNYSRTGKDGDILYDHEIQFPTVGTSEELKCFLENLEAGFYFAAVKYTTGLVEIYGFDYGLKPSDFKVDLINAAGGTLIKIKSDGDSLEDRMPYIYKSLEATPQEDYDNLFEDITVVSNGDFNNDFNNDFFV